MKRWIRSWYIMISPMPKAHSHAIGAEHVADGHGHVDRIGVQERKDLGLFFAEAPQVALVFLDGVDADDVAFGILAVEQPVGLGQGIERHGRRDFAQIERDGTFAASEVGTIFKPV